ncbi:hypothetical protein GSVR_38680 [Geobacter sp. SVR]|nr:hypothetical protein GSVR_38680 [Geobacter sp. SVR]
MRPYAGIGILMLSPASEPGDTESISQRLYQEPAILRQGEVDFSRVPDHEWIFGSAEVAYPLIVTARRGNWLRVVYDDAGREAWLMAPSRKGYRPWDEFLKGQAARLLPGLRKQFYQIFRQPGGGGGAALTGKSGFRIIRIEDDWAQVITDQNNPGWLRWRDEDGRLLVGLDRAAQNH